MTDTPGRTADLLADVATGVTEAAAGPVGSAPEWLRLRDGWRRVAAFVVLFAVCTGQFFAAIEQLEGFGVGFQVAPLLAATQTVPLLLLPTAPLLAWRWLVPSLLLGTVLTPAHDWPWPATSMLILAGVLYLVALTRPRRTVIGVWVLTTLVVLLPGTVIGGVPTALAILLSGLFALVLLLGDTVRDRGVVRVRLARATAQRREDLARQAVLEERAHIARELHDVVAHHMSMIAVQAEAAPLRYPDLSPEAVRTFAVIRDASREALTEMRRVVGGLRQDDDVVDRAPQPGADQVVELVAAARRAGTDVAFTVTGDQRPLPAAVDVSVYRLVQEALSNSRRHAPGAAVQVSLEFLRDKLVVTVTDDGSPREPATPAAPARQPLHAEAADG